MTKRVRERIWFSEKYYKPTSSPYYILLSLRLIFIEPRMNTILKFFGRCMFLSCSGFYVVNMALIALSSMIYKNVPSKKLFETIIYGLFLVCVMLIYVLSFRDGNLLHLATSIMLEIWEEFETDYERNIVMEKLKQGFTISVLYIGIVYAIFVGCSCHPAVKYKVMNLIFVNKTIERETFFPVYFTKYVQDNYYFVLFATVMGSIFLGAILGTLNYLQYTLTKFVIALFIIISRDLIQIQNDIEFSCIHLTDKEKVAIINEKLRSNIYKHQKAIELLTILQLYTHQKYLIIIIIIIIDLSLTGFVFLYFISFDKIYALETIVWFVVSVLNLFYIIYPGQQLMNANNKLREACCSCKWHMFRAKERKLILLMMIRSSKPYVLTAGPTIPMSYETSTHILRHVVSYLMALYQISRDFK